MRIIADEHVPPGFVAALRGEGHDVVTVEDAVGLGANDDRIRAYAGREQRTILSEDTDFRRAGADMDDHPGILACDTGASPGSIAAAVRRVESLSGDLTNTVVRVPGDWI